MMRSCLRRRRGGCLYCRLCTGRSRRPACPRGSPRPCSPRPWCVETRTRRHRLRDAHRVLPGAVEEVGLEKWAERHCAEEDGDRRDDGDDLVVEGPLEGREIRVLQARQFLLVAVADLLLG